MFWNEESHRRAAAIAARQATMSPPETPNLPATGKDGHTAKTHPSQRDIAECAQYDRQADARQQSWETSPFYAAWHRLFAPAGTHQIGPHV